MKIDVLLFQAQKVLMFQQQNVLLLPECLLVPGAERPVVPGEECLAPGGECADYSSSRIMFLDDYEGPRSLTITNDQGS